MRVNSISKKISIVTVVFIAIFIGAVFTTINFTVGKVLSQNIVGELTNKSNVLNSNLEDLKKKALNATEWFQSSPRLINAYENNDRPEALKVGQLALKSMGLDYLVITDNNGKVFIRAHDPATYDDNIGKQVNIQKALKGESSVGIEEGAVVKYSIRAGAPIKDKDGNIIGAISLGYVLSNNEFVDKQKKLFNCDVSIFSGDERIASTIVDGAGKRIVGIKLDNASIIETVLKNGKQYQGDAIVQGRNYLVAYSPVIDVSGKPSGMLVIAEDAGIISNVANQLMANQAVVLVILGILLVACIILLIRWLVVNKIKTLQVLMTEASEGNLLVKAVVQTKDEIGQLCESFNTMVSSQLKIVKAVKNSSVELSAASQEMAASSMEVSLATTSVSENIQRVAQSMEDASNSSSETSQVLIELSALIQIASDKATSASFKSENSITAAKEGKGTVNIVMQSMNTIQNKTREAEKVITLLNEYSQQIGMINETITAIAKQTNLLALNAAIEAARAGESGRGFAVVAEEVRKLAEQSNAEASNISQLISKIRENTDSAVVAMKDSLAEVEVGVEEVSKAGKSLENILMAVAESVNDIDGIAKVTNDEVASSDKIVQLIESVAEVIEGTSRDAQEVSSAIEETAATIEMVAASSEQTSAMAQNLHNLITKFKVEE